MQWAASDQINIKLQAFLGVKEFIVKLGSVAARFRKVYLEFFKYTKLTNWRNYELINFMINCYNDLM